MKLDRDSVEYASLDVSVALEGDVTEESLAGASLEVSVDEGPFEAWAWSTTATTELRHRSLTDRTLVPWWDRTGRRLVAGPDVAAPGSALVLPLGRRNVRWRILGTVESPVRPADAILVS